MYVQNAWLLNVTAGKVTSVAQKDSQTQNGVPYLGNESLLMVRDLTEREQRYSSTTFLISALDEGGWSTPRPGRFTPRNDSVPTVQEAGWAPGPVSTGEESLPPPPPPGFNSRTVEPVASRYID
jgi:hypothetical protein